MSYRDTVDRFLDVCNQAIMLHDDEFPYKQILSATTPWFEGKKWGMAIYDQNPEILHDYFTLEFRDNKFHVTEHGDAGAEYCWKVPESYLKDVTDNPGPYLETPAKLDWEWFKQRMNIA